MSEASLVIKIDGAKAERTVQRLERAFTRMDRASGKSIRQTGKLEASFNKLKLAAAAGAAAIAVGVVAALKSGVQTAVEFEKSMAEISTLLSGDVTQATAEVKEGIEQMALAYGGDLTTNANAAYQIISAGASSAEEAITILDTANRLAIGGVTDVSTAADGLTSALNAYGAGAEEAGDYSDAMFVAMKAGKTTIGELAGGLGVVAPLASQVGVSFDELLAATSAVTSAGVKTTEAFTQVRSALVAVVKPSDDALAAAKEMGIDFSTAALKSKGLSGFLAEVAEKTDGSQEAMARLFPQVEALNAALSLTGNQAAQFADNMQGMADKAGATDEAFEKMKGTFQFEWDRLRQTFVLLTKQLGEKLLPHLTEFVRLSNIVIKAIFDLNTTPLDDLNDQLTEAQDNLGFMLGRVIELQQQKADALFANNADKVRELSGEIDIANEAYRTQKENVADLERKIKEYGKTSGSASDETSDLVDEVSDLGDAAGESGGAAESVEALNFQLTDMESALNAASAGLGDYKDSLYAASAEHDLLQEKVAILIDFWKDTGDIETYNAKMKELFPTIEQMGDDTETQVDRMTEIWTNFTDDTQEAFGDLIYDGFKQIFDDGESAWKAFTDSLLDMFLRMIANMVAAWATSGITKLLAGEGFAGFGGSGVGDIAVGAAKASGGFETLGSSIGSMAAKLFGVKAASGAVTQGMGAMAPATEEAAFQALQAGKATTSLSGSLPALGVGLAGVAAMMAFQSVKAGKQAAVTAEVTAKFQEATDVVNTASLTWGVWGDEGLVALNKVHGGSQLFRDVMVAAGVSVRRGADGMQILGDTTETTRQMVVAYNDTVAAGLQSQIEAQKTKLGLNDQDNADRSAILQVEKDITAEWEASLKLINSSSFDDIVREFEGLGIAAGSVFRDITADGQVTRDELKTAFGNASAGIIAEMGDASTISVTKLNHILGIGKGAASGIEGGFKTAASNIASDMVSGTNKIQSAINELHGVSISSVHTIETRYTGGIRNDEKATGTPPGGLIVPPGFPNDTFTVGLTSGERYYVDTPAQQRDRNRSGGGSNANVERLLVKLIEGVSAMDSNNVAAINNNTANRDGHEYQRQTNESLQELSRA